MLALTRTASLADFDRCDSVAVWQQCLAIDAYQRWLQHTPVTYLHGILCYNWGAAHFRAPGPHPIYREYGELYTEPDPLAAIFALSVLDRVIAPLRFLRHLAAQIQPDGLIVCTFAAWDAVGEDCAVGHELRQRIYDRDAWRKLLYDVKGLGLEAFGGVDYRYHGDTLGDHTLATLVVSKGRLPC
jgi:hypothetical protein